MSKKNILKAMMVVVLGLFLLPAVSNAAITCTGGTDDEVCTKIGAKCIGGKCTTDFGMTDVETGLGGTLGSNSLIDTVTNIINVVLGLLGIVAVVIVLIGGFQWMTAGGNDEKAGEARKRIFAGIIGLAIILSAWAIAKFVIGSLSTATGSGDVKDTEIAL